MDIEYATDSTNNETTLTGRFSSDECSVDARGTLAEPKIDLDVTASLPFRKFHQVNFFINPVKPSKTQ